MTKKKDSFNYEKAYRQSVLKISKSQTEIKQLKHELVVREKIIEIQDEEISLNKALKDTPPLIYGFDIVRSSSKDIVPIINIGDMHVESVIEPSVVLGLNKSNPDIIKRRMYIAAAEALNYLSVLEKEFKVKQCIIQFKGDNITNYIHEELKKSNALSPFQAIFAARDIIINFVKRIVDASSYPSIRIVFIRGNHSRNSIKKEYSLGYLNSFEFDMYNQVIEYFQNAVGYKHLEFILPDSEYAVLKVFDKTIATSHGDHFKYAGGIGGLQMPMMRWDYKLQNTMPVNKRYIGHWHTFLNTKRVTVSASICGYDPFALGHSFEFEPPSINIDVCHIDHGFMENRLIPLPTFL